MEPIFKSARGEVPAKLEWLGLDFKGLRHLQQLRERLVRHLYFEHLGRRPIGEWLMNSAHSYRAVAPTARPKWRQFDTLLQAKVLVAEWREE